MNCPYCGYRFRVLAANAADIPDLAPIVCEDCAAVGLLVDGQPRKTTPEELAALKESPAWREVIRPTLDIIKNRYATSPPPVDRTRTQLTDGSPVTPEHLEIDPRTGQQKGYVVLTPEERAKGFVRPVRRTYTHVGIRPKHPTRPLTHEEQEHHRGRNYVVYEEYPLSANPITGRFWTQAQLTSGCGRNTTMEQSIAETYARDPGFYGGTMCFYCRAHFPLEEFVWKGTNVQVGS